MSICIIDPAAHMPGLKLLFPEAEYFSHEPDSFFTYISTHHYTKQKNKEEYGFEYRTDWENINSNNFDIKSSFVFEAALIKLTFEIILLFNIFFNVKNVKIPIDIVFITGFLNTG